MTNLHEHEERERRRQAWTSYWQSGVLHSFPTSFSGNYDGVIASFWQEVASSVAEGGRVLDLASGNGSVPLLLLQSLRNQVHIDAVDAAGIAPRVHPSNVDDRITFHPNVWLENLPFPQDSFDCVCSQFGIEYAAQPQAWDEVLRVLKDSGQIACVIHHRNSVFCTVARYEKRHLQWLLAANGLMSVALEVAGWLELMRAGSALSTEERGKAHLSRSRFNELQELVELEIRGGQAVDILIEARAQINAILAKSPEPGQAITNYRELLDRSLVRCRELVDCAMDQRQFEDLASLLRARRPNIEMQIEELSQQQGLLGWSLRVRTPHL